MGLGVISNTAMMIPNFALQVVPVVIFTFDDFIDISCFQE